MIDKVVDNLGRYRHFLLTAHTSLDGDAVGSQLALKELLLALGKEVIILNENDTPDVYVEVFGCKIPGIKHIDSFSLAHLNLDCVIFLDVADRTRVGRVNHYIREGIPIINIDHHISNQYFGNVNWVVPDSSSVSELIYEIFKKMKIELTEKASLYLYVGIFTDSGRFCYRNTSSHTHRIVADLLQYNIHPERINSTIYENMSLSSVILFQKALSTLRLTNDGKIAWLEVRQKDFKDALAKPEDTENFVEYIRAIKGVEIAIFFQEVKSDLEVRVSFRSKGKIDVNKIANHFGGGGHSCASGLLIKGKIDSVKKEIIDWVSLNAENL